MVGCATPGDSGGAPDTGGPDSGAPDTADTATTDTADTDTADSDSGAPDADGDGSPDADDCDDADPAVHPGATEACNQADDDCDGLVDDACHPARLGEVPTAMADTHLRWKGAPSLALQSVLAKDVDGDGLADLVVDGDSDTTDLLYLPGPVLGDVDAATAARSLLVGDEGSYRGVFSTSLRFADADGDGAEDLLASTVYGYRFYLFPAFAVGRELSAASLEIQPEQWGDWFGAEGNATLVPGAPGAVVISLIALSDADCSAVNTVLVAADTTGVVGTSAAIPLGPDVRDDCSSVLATPHAVDDLDGDGVGELVVAGATTDLYLGPIDVASAGRSADARFGDNRAWDWYATGDVTAADLDGDGRAELVLIQPATGGVDPSGQLGVARDDGTGAVTLAEAPIVVAPADLAMRAITPLDANGDGWVDLAWLGADADESLAGVEYGPFAGTRDLMTAGASMVVHAGVDAENFTSVASGDTNGDGYADLFLGTDLGGDDDHDHGEAWGFLGGP